MTAAVRAAQRPSYRTGWIASAILLTLMAATLLAAAARAQDPASPYDLLTGRILGETPMMRDLHELTDGIGGRLSGSAACERAISWAEGKFKAIGADEVTLEPFSLPNAWQSRGGEGSCVAPVVFPLRVVAVPGTSGTPGGKPIEARVVDAGSGTPGEIAKLGESLRGAVALVRNAEMKSLDDLFAEYMKATPLLEAAAKAGAAAILLESSRPRGLLYRHPMTFDGSISPLPVALVSREEADRMLRLAADGEVRVRLALDVSVKPMVTSSNVVATIRGTDRAREIVLVGAHLDSFELGTGANDNGVSCAQIIDLARQIRALGVRPRRSILFALFTGEEQGMLGSRAYVLRHAARLDDYAAAVVFDTGSGRLAGFYLDGREDVRPAVDAGLAHVASLGPFVNPIDALDGTDNFDFLLSGIPNLVGAQDPAPYLPDYHAESDTFDKVDAREAKAAEAALAAVVWELANRDARPGPRQTRTEVDALIKATSLEGQMKAFAQWTDWVERRRGIFSPPSTPR